MTGKVPADHVDAVIVGAGFAGLYAHHRLRALGLTLRGFEAAPEVGGTWFWNRYPGARCDVESLDYSYSFDAALMDEWRWSERFATQPEILRYAAHVADRFDLRRDIAFATRVTGAAFDPDRDLWTVEADDGARTRCRFLICATGSLSLPKPPDVPGLADFAGEWVTTAAWPADGVDLAGRRVAVIGTGSSGIQAIPLIAREAAHLTVFQRTANFSVPAGNGPIDPAHEARVRADYPAWKRHIRRTRGGQRADLSSGRPASDFADDARQAMMERAWRFGLSGLQAVFGDVARDPAVNAEVAGFVHAKIRAAVADPATAARLSPAGYPFGAKRLCLDTGYYETFNRANVALVDLRATPIVRIGPAGIVTAAGEHPVDLIVFATGFDAITGALLAIDPRGADGRTLRAAWTDGPASYLGLTIAGFPNLFTVNGPMSPSVLTNMIASIEHHVDWIADCIGVMRAAGHRRVEADPAAEAAWAREVAAIADATLFPQADSWYVGANVPGKPRRFMCYLAGFDRYQDRCAAIAADGYAGLVFDGGAAPPPPMRAVPAENETR